jgi:hypothetical protein
MALMNLKDPEPFLFSSLDNRDESARDNEQAGWIKARLGPGSSGGRFAELNY